MNEALDGPYLLLNTHGEIIAAHGAEHFGWRDNTGIIGLHFRHLVDSSDIWEQVRTNTLQQGSILHHSQQQCPKGRVSIWNQCSVSDNQHILCQPQTIAFEQVQFLSPVDTLANQILYGWLTKISKLCCHCWFEGNKAIAVFSDRRMASLAWKESRAVREHHQQSRQGFHIQVRYVDDEETILCDSECLEHALGQKIADDHCFPRGRPSMVKSTLDLITAPFRASNGIITIPDPGVLMEMVAVNPNLKVIRWSTNTGIACGAHAEASSGLTPQQWVGRQMDEALAGGKRTWIPEEFQRFQQALFDHLCVTEFQYRSHLYTGELCQFTVNAVLGTYQGLIRLVEVLDCTPL